MRAAHGAWLTRRVSDGPVSDIEEEETAADKRLRLAKEAIAKAEAYGMCLRPVANW